MQAFVIALPVDFSRASKQADLLNITIQIGIDICQLSNCYLTRFRFIQHGHIEGIVIFAACETDIFFCIDGFPVFVEVAIFFQFGRALFGNDPWAGIVDGLLTSTPL